MNYWGCCFLGKHGLAYEVWIPAVFIAIAGVSLLIDFGDLATSEPLNDQDDDLFEMDEISDDFDALDAGHSGAVADFPMVAANSPDAPTQS